jgi:hypothetical protein
LKGRFNATMYWHWCRCLKTSYRSHNSKFHFVYLCMAWKTISCEFVRPR